MSRSGSRIRAGRAEIELAVADRVSAALGQIEGRLRSFAKGAAGLGAPLAAAGGAILGALGLPTKLAAEMEQTSTSFEVMLGSAARAEALLKRLQQLGAETPFEFPELADAAKKLLAFGSEAATLPDELRRLGDVASGVGMPIGELAELYGKMRTQGTLYAEDLNQLLGRGIPALQMFADQMGVPVAAVKKLGSEGKITFPMLEQMMIDLTSEGGRFAGMMAKQSATSAGKWSTFKDNVTASLRAVGDGLLPLVNQVMDLGSKIVAAVTPWIEVFKPLVPIIAATGAAVAGLGVVLLGVAGASAALGWAIGAVAPIVAGVFGGLGAVVAAVTSPIGLVVAGIVGLGTVAQQLFGVFDPVFKWLSDGWHFVASTFSTTWAGIVDALTAGDLTSAANIAMAGIKVAIATGLESIAGLFGVTIDELAKSLAHLWHQLATFASRLNSMRAESSQWLAEMMGAVVGVEVTREDNAALSSAAQWEQQLSQVDLSAVQDKIKDALDPATYQKELEELTSKAAEAAEKVRLEARTAAEDTTAPSAPKVPDVSATAKAVEQFAAVGNFSAAMVGQQLPNAKKTEQQIAANTKKSNELLTSIRDVLQTNPGLLFSP